MKTNNFNIETNLVSEIAKGKYRDTYLVYNRKSTDDSDNQKNSISYQKAENTRFAYREKLSIAKLSLQGFCTEGIITEKHSGFKEDYNVTINNDGVVQYSIERPKFQKMLQYLSKGYFKGIICLCWDRISRNGGDDTLINKLMKKGVDVRFAYAEYSKTSSGALHMDIDGMFARHHSRVTSEKVTLTIRNAREKGICTYRAPIGYLNLGQMENKPIDIARAPIIKKIFEYYASGEWSLSDLARYANSQGLVTIPMRRRRTQDEILAEEDDENVKLDQISRPLNPNHVSRILTNPFYVGKILGNNGKFVNSTSHQAIVSEELFEKAQTMLGKKRVSIHYINKLDLPLRGVIRCNYCNRVYTPYIKKGINYYNSRCIANCKNTFKNFNFLFIDKEISAVISKLYLSDKEIEDLNTNTQSDISELEEKRRQTIDNLERQKKKIREDIYYLRSNKLLLLKTGVYSPEGYLEEETKLSEELLNAQNTEQISDMAMHETMKEVIKLSELIKNLMAYYSFANPSEKEKIVRILFSELFVSQNTFKFKCKKGFECLANRFSTLCDPNAWLSELLLDSCNIQFAISELNQFNFDG